MQRRNFLRRLIGGTLALAVAPQLLAEIPAATPMIPLGAAIGEYANYTNFSEFAIASAIDQCVLDAANELSYNAGKSISVLYEQVLESA